MLEYVALAVGLLAIDLVLLLQGGWLTNFAFGLVSIIASVQFFNQMTNDLPLSYVVPLAFVVMGILLFVSALSRSDTI